MPRRSRSAPATLSPPRRLPLRPLFHERESFPSVLARGAAQRGISLRSLHAKLGLPTEGAATPDVVATAEAGLGFERGALAAWAWTTPGAPLLTFRESVFSGATGITQRIRICLGCLAEDRSDETLERNPDNRPWLRSFWSVIFITCCPVHGTPLVDRCRCGRDVEASVPFDVCGSGHVIAAPASPTAPDASRLSAELLEALEGPCPVTQGPLHGLSWLDAGRLTLRLGALARTGRMDLGVCSTIGLGELLGDCDGGRAFLDDLPDAFGRVLNRAEAATEAGGALATVAAREQFVRSMDRWLTPIGNPLVDGLKTSFETHRRRGVEVRAAEAAVVAATRPRWRPAEMPGPRFHRFMAHVPGEASLDRNARARTVWATPLTDTEARRFESEGLEMRAGMTRLDALHIARDAGAVTSLVGIASALKVRVQRAGVLVDNGILPTAWATDGALPVCYQSDVAHLAARLHECASRYGPVDDDVQVSSLGGRVFGEVVGRALDGLPTFSNCVQDGIAGLLVSRSDVRRLGFTERLRPASMSLAEFCDANDLLRDFLTELTADRFVVGTGEGSYRTIGNLEADTFARLYVSSRAIARMVDVTTRWVTVIGKRQGVEPAYSGSHGRLFHRTDLPNLIAALAAAGAAERSSFRPVLSVVSTAHPWRADGDTLWRTPATRRGAAGGR